MSQSLGSALDQLGVVANFDEGDFIANAMVVLRVVSKDGSVYLRKCHSDGTDMVTRRGMLDVAQALERACQSSGWI